MRLINQKKVIDTGWDKVAAHNKVDWYDYLSDPNDTLVWDRQVYKVTSNRTVYDHLHGMELHLDSSEILRRFPVIPALPRKLVKTVKSFHRKDMQVEFGEVILLSIWGLNAIVGLRKQDGSYAFSLEDAPKPTSTSKSLFADSKRNTEAVFNININLSDLHDLMEAPLILVKYSDEDRYSNPTITANPNLISLGYYCDPNILVQNIDMWLGNRNYQDPLDNPRIDDKIKAQKAGHGSKYSFRKMPTRVIT